MSDPAEAAVWQRVQERAAAHPTAVAISGERDITYGDLVSRVCELAARLKALDASNPVVAIDSADPLTGVVAILAAHAAGAAALPLDHSAPAARRNEAVTRAGAGVVVCAAGHGYAVHAVHNGHGSTMPVGIAYILFTSGSTGTPKGVMVGHEALADRLEGLAAVPGLQHGQSIAALTALSFDISMAEMFLPLWVGGAVCTAPAAARFDRATFSSFLERHRPDVVQATPSFWRLMIASGWEGAPWLTAWCGGEALTPNLAARLRPMCSALWNVYGPTEATIWATASRVEDGRPISLGAPLPGTYVHLVPEGGTPAPSVSHGEIVLSGAGLAAGYLGDSELTARRFRHYVATGVAYHTGDLGAYRPDGSLEFLGRIDTQVKIRGHRIELGEIESLAEEHSTVTAAVAVARNTDDLAKAHIHLFVTAREGASTTAVRQWLRTKLPGIMVPKTIDIVDELPRNSAGKIDRKRLT